MNRLTLPAIECRFNLADQTMFKKTLPYYEPFRDHFNLAVLALRPSGISEAAKMAGVA